MSGTLRVKPYAACTPREWWVQEIFGDRKCDSCGDAPVAVVAHVALPASHLRAVDPRGMLLGKYGPPINFRKSLATEAYHYYEERAACARCQRAMEEHLARCYRDSAYVSFDRPPADKLIILVSG